jgi:DNA-directed RNA polymerase alpha subunit
MKEIYILAKPEEVSKVENIINDKLKEIANIKIITDINEISEEHRKNLEIINLDEQKNNKQSDIDFNTLTYHNIPASIPTIEELTQGTKTEFQKLSSFDRKEKNQARKKLEHQALKYQNRHYKK